MTKFYKLLFISALLLFLCSCSSEAEKQYLKPVIVKPDEETHYTINGYKETSVSENTASDNENSSAEIVYIGNRTSNKYHLPDCTYAVNMKPENKREFDKFSIPEDYGYVKCKQCLKDK